MSSTSSDFPCVLDRCGAASRPALFQGRCKQRVCYSPKTTADGERCFGRFSLDADSLANAVWNRIASDEKSEPHPSDLALHHWLRDNDADDDEVTLLPEAWRGIEPSIEQVFPEETTRVFCTCCNRNFRHSEVKLESPHRYSEALAYRYHCPSGHLLFVADLSAVQWVGSSLAA